MAATMKFRLLFSAITLLAVLGTTVNAKEKQKKPPKLSPLELYLQEARLSAERPANPPTPGSAWSPDARFFDVASDLRASRVHDVVTIVVRESASAVSQGSVSSSRSSNASASIDALGGIPRATGPLTNLLGLNSESALEGQGETVRRTVLTATMTARVVEVLPNGNLVIEGQKNVGVNSEEQIITVRGVVRPVDVSVANTISSEQIAQMELKVNGKGVVGDAIRRPNIFYRILLGILPF